MAPDVPKLRSNRKLSLCVFPRIPPPENDTPLITKKGAPSLHIRTPRPECSMKTLFIERVHLFYFFTSLTSPNIREKYADNVPTHFNTRNAARKCTCTTQSFFLLFVQTCQRSLLIPLERSPEPVKTQTPTSPGRWIPHVSA